MAERKLLEGIRILDCASWIAGPAAATIAADFGAEVIKIEPPVSGDSYRNKYSETYYAPHGCYDYPWFVDSRNKASLTLNLKSDQGQTIFEKLVRTADVVITNMPLKARKRLRLTYEDVKAIKEDIIYASLTPFGEKGPYSQDKAFDTTSFWARSGLMDLLRGRNDRPRSGLPGQGDHPTAMALFGGIMLALYDRERTGEGRMVSTSLLHNGIWANALAVQGGSTLEWFEGPSWDAGVVRFVKNAQYITRDERIVTFDMVDSEDEMCRLFDLLGIRERVVGHPSYKAYSKASPVVYKDESELISVVQGAISKWNQKDLLEAARESGITLVWINKIGDVKNDPQVVANRMMPDLDKDVFGVDKIVDSPLFLSGAKKEIHSPAPALGQHTQRILASIGYTEDAITELREQGVI